MSNPTTVFLGIDGGGTATKAVLSNAQGERLSRGQAAGSNPQFGVAKAQQALIDTAKTALHNADLAHIQLNQLTVGAGLAGVNDPTLFTQLNNWQHPFKAFYLTHDTTVAALGAHQGQPGALVILGTGSCGYCFDGKQAQLLGGHGFTLGDQASGAWLGLKALESVLLAEDGLLDNTLLTEALFHEANVTSIEALRAAYFGQPSRVFAKLAPIVVSLSSKDNVAGAILDEGTEYVNNLSRVLLDDHSWPIAFIGGLADTYRDRVAQDIKKRLIAAAAPPEEGALLFAMKESQCSRVDKN